jgi:hypothetical protein
MHTSMAKQRSAKEEEAGDEKTTDGELRPMTGKTTSIRSIRVPATTPTADLARHPEPVPGHFLAVVGTAAGGQSWRCWPRP